MICVIIMCDIVENNFIQKIHCLCVFYAKLSLNYKQKEIKKEPSNV